MFAKVMVAVDGKEGGLDASALAGVLADPEAEILLVRVLAGPSDDARAPRIEADFRASGAALTERVAGPEREALDITVESRSVPESLHRIAEEHSTDLLVIGSHHRRRTGQLWSPDRTRATLRDAPCPVAVAPQGYAGAPRRPIVSVGVAYDDTLEGRDALLFGRAIASETGGEIRVRWVVERSNWTDAQSGVGWRAIEANRRLAEVHGIVGSAIEGDARHAEDVLADFAREVDILILGSHHHGLLFRLVLGGTVHGLSRDPTGPLLVLPHARPAPALGPERSRSQGFFRGK